MTSAIGVTGGTKEGLILVVEDDDPTRELMLEAIGVDGWSTVCAADGAEAVRLLAEMRTPDVILLDWRMPTPGNVFAEQYRKLPPPHAPIVVVSAASEIADAARQVNASGFLRKPFDIDELLELVRGFVRSADVDAHGDAAAAPDVPSVVPVRTTALIPTREGDRARRKRATEEWRRRQTLGRMAREVADIRAAATQVRGQIQELLAAEQSRRLTAEEVDLVRQLRWESERHRWDLQVLRDQFEQLRRSPRSHDDTPARD